MKSRWIVLANASQARFFRRESPAAPLMALSTLEHAQSRMRGSQLADDRPGHEAVDGSPGGNRFEPRTDPKRKEHRRFAREVAERLDDALAEEGFGSLCLVASDPFLGELKAELSGAVAHRLALTVASDWTACGLTEVEERLRGVRARA